MEAGMGTIVLLLLTCLSPYGPADLQDGASWTYVLHEGPGPSMVQIEIVDISENESGLSVGLQVTEGEHVAPLTVDLSPDRRTLRRAGVPDTMLYVPEFAPGVTWEIPGEGTLTVTDVATGSITTVAGEFPEALKVSVGGKGAEGAFIWLQQGVGLVAAGEDGRRALELTSYNPGSTAVSGRPAPRMGRTGRRPGGASIATPAVTALDAKTFVVADPVTRTVTVFRILMPGPREWKLTRVATAPYAPDQAAAEE